MLLGNGQPWHTHYPLTGGHVTALGMPGFSFSEKQTGVKPKVNARKVFIGN